MAEKEERIYVYRFTDDDGICPLEEFCTKFPGQCGDCKEIPTRTETVEKMAKAICLERHACISKGEMCGLCELWRNFSTHAEAALDALLD